MKSTVPVGPTTVAGYTVTASSLALAILAYFNGDHSQQTVGVIVAGAVATVAFAITQIGRYAQANTIAKRTITQTFTTPAVRWTSGNAVTSIDLGSALTSPMAGVDDPDPEPADVLDPEVAAMDVATAEDAGHDHADGQGAA